MLELRIPYKSTYQLVEASRHISTHKVQEIVDEQLIEFCFLGVQQEELAFSIRQLESSRIFFPETLSIQLELDFIFDKLVVTTDLSGTFKRVLNQVEIASNWLALKRKLKLNYRMRDVKGVIAEVDRLLEEPEELEKLVCSSKYRFLLADFSNANPQQQSVIGEKQVDYFLEAHSLPLLTSDVFASTPDQTSTYTIETVGILNEEKFNHKSFAKWLRSKIDIYDLSVAMTADFEQRYLLDRNQKVTYAEQFLSAEVAGCYSQTRARTLKLLS